MEITRDLYSELDVWFKQDDRKPLLLRGARQVGKSYLVRTWAKRTLGEDNFLEINFEEFPKLKGIFEADLDINRILDELTLFSGRSIKSGEVLVFFDEIQICPQAITCLRYFYEKAPNIPVIAAGSLLEFVLQEISFPVGRISSIYVRPISYFEYLSSIDKSHIREYLEDLKIDGNSKIPEYLHSDLLHELKKYFLIGGMPKAVSVYIKHRDLSLVSAVHNDILSAYYDDFPKYSKKSEWDVLKIIFEKIPFLVAGTKIKYTSIDRNFRIEKIKRALLLLEYAGLITKVISTNAKQPPLNSQAKLSTFKLLSLDIGLLQHSLGFDWSSLSPDSNLTDTCRGKFAEQFVGQEFLASSSVHTRSILYYWCSMKYHSDAEIDYVTEFKNKVVPIEVKSGTRGTLKSLTEYEKQFKPGLSIVFSERNIEKMENTIFLPLYLAGCLKRGNN
jgi:uncharacterized protein